MTSASIAALAASNAAIAASRSSGGGTELSAEDARMLLAILTVSLVIGLIAAVVSKVREPDFGLIGYICIGIFAIAASLLIAMIGLFVMQLAAIAF